MKNQNGYTVPELIVIVVIVGIISFVGISKASYAFSEINNPEIEKEQTKSLVESAAKLYAQSKEDELKKEEDTFIFAKEIAQAGFLFEKEEYNSMKIKITYHSESDSFTSEVVE